MSDETVDLLKARGVRYGKFCDQASCSQALKDAMRVHHGWPKLAGDQAEALDMIVHKIARVLNGDPNYADNWVDIAGYATLITKRLQGEVL
jgi:hypothetical protein